MKKNIYLSIVFILYLYLTGCTTIKTLYLQNVEVKAPINQSPVHITDSTETPSVSVSMRFSYNPKKEIKARTEGTPKVNQMGVYQVDTIYHSDDAISYQKNSNNRYAYKGQNLTWNFASVNAAIDFDLKLSKNFALFGGLNYASGNKKTLWGGTGGIGLFGFKNGFGYRLDAGFHIQNISFDAHTIAEVSSTSFWGDSYEYVMFYHDIDEKVYFDPFINLTLNSAKKNWILNFFLNAGYSVQSLLDFEPQSIDYDWFFFPPFIFNENITNDYRGETTGSFIHFTPGVYFNINEYSRILLGVRIFYELELNDPSSNLLIIPMAQIDFNL